MPVGGVLIGARQREHFRVAIQLSDERKARGMALLVKSVRQAQHMDVRSDSLRHYLRWPPD